MSCREGYALPLITIANLFAQEAYPSACRAITGHGFLGPRATGNNKTLTLISWWDALVGATAPSRYSASPRYQIDTSAHYNKDW